MAEPFLGQIQIWACNFAPRSWAFCDGESLPIIDNQALYSVIGNTFGGNGRTTMKLPNLVGRAPLGYGRGPGLHSQTLGNSGGASAVALDISSMPAHSHGITAQNSDPNQQSPDQSQLSTAKKNAGPPPLRKIKMYGEADEENLTTLSGKAMIAEGGSDPHQNMQPYLAVNFCIALAGMYPVRG